MSALLTAVVWLVIVCLVYFLYDGCKHQPKISGVRNRYVLVTGCDSGFGALLVRALDGLGFPVIAACRSSSGQAELRRTCSSRLQTITLDITQHSSIQAAYIYTTESLLPNEGLWALVNNAGVVGVSAGPVEWMKSDDFLRTYQINTAGLIDMTLTFLPLLKKNGGRIINMSSSAGRLSTSLNLPYAVSMAGIEAFSDGLRQYVRQCDYGITVHLIEPGLYQTPFCRRENLARLLQATWDRMPEMEKRTFGDKYYHTYLGRMLGLFEVRGSRKLHQVIDAYVHAITAKNPRVRYTVGADAYCVVAMSYLPSWLVDWFMCTHNYGQWQPVPSTNRPPAIIATTSSAHSNSSSTAR